VNKVHYTVGAEEGVTSSLHGQLEGTVK